MFERFKCEACGKEFKGTAQYVKYFCSRCNKDFILCSDCTSSHVCDYCGETALLDFSEEHKKKQEKIYCFNNK